MQNTEMIQDKTRDYLSYILINFQKMIINNDIEFLSYALRVLNTKIFSASQIYGSNHFCNLFFNPIVNKQFMNN